ncbi:MAG: flagellar basal body rod protein FlgC [Bilophila sp.]
MDFMTALDIGASALTADRLSINVTAMNLANAKTTRTPEGGPYHRRTVIRAATDVDAPFSKQMQGALDRELKGVRVLNVLPDRRPDKKVYEPGHPDADAEGMVSYPDINVVEEMASLMTSQRNYEANTNTIDAIKNMYMKALEIGK